MTGDPAACDPVSGRKFRFGELLTPTLIFDAMGSLAGVQVVVNETTYPAYPQSNWRPTDGWFTATGDPPELSSMTIHFKDSCARLRQLTRLAVASATGSGSDCLRMTLRNSRSSRKSCRPACRTPAGIRAAAFRATSFTLARWAWDYTTGATPSTPR